MEDELDNDSAPWSEAGRERIHDKAVGWAIKATVVIMTIWVMCLALMIIFVPYP